MRLDTTFRLSDGLLIIGGIGAVAVVLLTVGVWKGAVDSKLDNQREMIAGTRNDVRDLNVKVDRVAETVASLDGKLSAMGTIKKIDGLGTVPALGRALIPVSVGP